MFNHLSVQLLGSKLISLLPRLLMRHTHYCHTSFFSSHEALSECSRHLGSPCAQRHCLCKLVPPAPLRGATAALTCIINSAFGRKDCLFFPIPLVKKSPWPFSGKKIEAPEGYVCIIKSEPHNLKGGIRCTIII